MRARTSRRSWLAAFGPAVLWNSSYYYCYGGTGADTAFLATRTTTTTTATTTTTNRDPSSFSGRGRGAPDLWKTKSGSGILRATGGRAARTSPAPASASGWLDGGAVNGDDAAQAGRDEDVARGAAAATLGEGSAAVVTARDTDEPNRASSRNHHGDGVVEPQEQLHEPWKTGTEDDAFDLVASLAYRVLVESDKRRDAVGKGSVSAGSSATNWIDEQASFYLQKALDKLILHGDGMQAPWTRWMKSTPCPAVLDMSHEFRNSVVASLHQERLEADARLLLPRLGCRILLLPSGAELSAPLLEPTASLVLGKLLYGGATRYRRLYASSSSTSSTSSPATPPRRVGMRTEVVAAAGEKRKGEWIASPSSSSSSNASPPPPPSWCMFGGLERMYEAVDMGACAILEIILLPQGKVHDPTAATSVGGTSSLASSSSSSSSVQHPFAPTQRGNLLMLNAPWKPNDVLVMMPETEVPDGRTTSFSPHRRYDEILTGSERNEAFVHDFSEVVGGLQPQIEAIVRRVLDGRMIRPVDEIGDDTNIENRDDNNNYPPQDPTLALDADELSALGLTPVRGLLLHGPPGTGKTLLARELSKALRARAPKIVSAPELLDRWVGGSEKAVRALFADAEAELAACDNDPAQSALHVIVIDEIDAVFRHRSATSQDSGEATRSSVVNQILAKLDGVNAIPNVLVIGMTNRRELIDDALLRPGRLEVQIEIPLPTHEGRREILQIHFGPLRRKGRLSGPLCCAIDGVSPVTAFADTTEFHREDAGVRMRKRDHLHRAWKRLSRRLPPYPLGEHSSATTKPLWRLSRRPPFFDLAGDATRGYSGADLAGLVRCAGSIALARSRRDGSGVSGLLITLEDVKQALQEVKG